jgi:hypothetical protein
VTAVTAILQDQSSSVAGGKATMAQDQQQALLKALKLELKFCELGGYEPSVPGRLPARASENNPISTYERTREWRQQHSVFEDSPSCLNYGLPEKEHPCSECWLMHFVPTEKRDAAVPCHHIPLNEHGDTVATLGRWGDAPDVQKAVLDWLRRTIQQLEGAPAQSQQPAP